MTVAAPLLSFDDLTLGYDRHPAVHHLKGSVPRGDLLAVIGPNGAGKSTLLKGIVGGLRPQGGAICLNGVARDQIAYLPQQSEIDRSFPIAAFDFVAMGLWREVGALRGLDPRLIEQIRKETGAAVGGTLYSDALSGPDGPAATYLQMFRYNTATLITALSS